MPIYGSCHKIIDSSICIFFHLPQDVNNEINPEKTWKLGYIRWQKRMDIIAIIARFNDGTKREEVPRNLNN